MNMLTTLFAPHWTDWVFQSLIPGVLRWRGEGSVPTAHLELAPLAAHTPRGPGIHWLPHELWVVLVTHLSPAGVAPFLHLCLLLHRSAIPSKTYPLPLSGSAPGREADMPTNHNRARGSRR